MGGNPANSAGQISQKTGQTSQNAYFLVFLVINNTFTAKSKKIPPHIFLTKICVILF